MCQCSRLGSTTTNRYEDRSGYPNIRRLIQATGTNTCYLGSCPDCGTYWEMVRSASYYMSTPYNDNNGFIYQKVPGYSPDEWRARREASEERVRARLPELERFFSTYPGAVQVVVNEDALTLMVYIEKKSGLFGGTTSDQFEVYLDPRGRYYFSPDGENRKCDLKGGNETWV